MKKHKYSITVEVDTQGQDKNAVTSQVCDGFRQLQSAMLRQEMDERTRKHLHIGHACNKPMKADTVVVGIEITTTLDEEKFNHRFYDLANDLLSEGNFGMIGHKQAKVLDVAVNHESSEGCDHDYFHKQFMATGNAIYQILSCQVCGDVVKMNVPDIKVEDAEILQEQIMETLKLE